MKVIQKVEPELGLHMEEGQAWMIDKEEQFLDGWRDNNVKWLWHIAVLIHTETELRVMLINLTAISTGFWIRKDMERKAEG